MRGTVWYMPPFSAANIANEYTPPSNYMQYTSMSINTYITIVTYTQQYRHRVWVNTALITITTAIIVIIVATVTYISV